MESLPDTTMSTDAVGALVAEGKAAQIAGDSYAARQRFRQALDLDPERVEAWVGLAGSVRPYREKREHLQRALAIDPANPEARAVLAQVEARLAAGEVLAPTGVQLREPTPPAGGPPSPDGAAWPVSPPGADPASPTATALFCYLHPDRETGLRCTSCDRPICAECAKPAVVGQLCPECAKIRRPVNYQVTTAHLAIAGGVTVAFSAVVSTLGLLLLGNMGFFSFIIAFLLGPVAGELLVRLLDRLTHGKRGRPMQVTVGVAYGLGVLAMLAGSALFFDILSPVGIGLLLVSMPLGLYLLTAMVIITAMARLR